MNLKPPIYIYLQTNLKAIGDKQQNNSKLGYQALKEELDNIAIIFLVVN